MSEGKMSVFYVVAALMVLLSLTLFVNGSVGTDTPDHPQQAGSSVLSNILFPNDHNVGGTLYDVICYDHNTYFGLRS